MGRPVSRSIEVTPVPFGGTSPTVGTNPHSWAFPTTHVLGFPIVIDWATTLTPDIDVTLDRTPYTTWGGYGGLSFRGTRNWLVRRFLLPGGGFDEFGGVASRERLAVRGRRSRVGDGAETGESAHPRLISPRWIFSLSFRMPYIGPSGVGGQPGTQMSTGMISSIPCTT